MEPHSPFQRCCHFLSPLGQGLSLTTTTTTTPHSVRVFPCMNPASPRAPSIKEGLVRPGEPGRTRAMGIGFISVFQSMPLHSLRIGQGEELGIPKHAARRHLPLTPRCLAPPSLYLGSVSASLCHGSNPWKMRPPFILSPYERRL